jgi:hypothetical protein
MMLPWLATAAASDGSSHYVYWLQRLRRCRRRWCYGQQQLRQHKRGAPHELPKITLLFATRKGPILWARDVHKINCRCCAVQLNCRACQLRQLLLLLLFLLLLLLLLVAAGSTAATANSSEHDLLAHNVGYGKLLLIRYSTIVSGRPHMLICCHAARLPHAPRRTRAHAATATAHAHTRRYGGGAGGGGGARI